MDKSSKQAKSAARARRLAGKNQNIDQAIETLKKAAAQGDVDAAGCRHVRPGPQRAGSLLSRELRTCGVMREFTRQYKWRRAAATARGEGFMSYSNAEARLR